jgi:hypothetical protein
VKQLLVQWVRFTEDAPRVESGVYFHALEIASWLRDNDLEEAAGEVEASVREILEAGE